MGIVERKERERQEMRRMIVSEALKISLAEGFDKLSLRGLAQKIEYSPATIYLYFKDKDELFCEMHDMAFERLFGKFEETNDIKNPLEKLRRIGEIYVAFAFDNPELYDLMFMMQAPMNADKYADSWQCGLKTYHFMLDTVSQCIEAGYLRKESPDMLSFCIWTMVHGMVALILRNRVDKVYPGLDRTALVHETINMAFRMLVN